MYCWRPFVGNGVVVGPVVRVHSCSCIAYRKYVYTIVVRAAFIVSAILVTINIRGPVDHGFAVVGAIVFVMILLLFMLLLSLMNC